MIEETKIERLLDILKNDGKENTMMYKILSAVPHSASYKSYPVEVQNELNYYIVKKYSESIIHWDKEDFFTKTCDLILDEAVRFVTLNNFSSIKALYKNIAFDFLSSFSRKNETSFLLVGQFAEFRSSKEVISHIENIKKIEILSEAEIQEFNSITAFLLNLKEDEVDLFIGQLRMLLHNKAQ